MAVVRTLILQSLISNPIYGSLKISFPFYKREVEIMLLLVPLTSKNRQDSMTRLPFVIWMATRRLCEHILISEQGYPAWL